MIIADDFSEARKKLTGKILEENTSVQSRFGEIIKSKPAFIVIKKPEYVDNIDNEFWSFCGDNYVTRIEDFLNVAASKLSESPFTRRVSLPLWMPADHLCENPPAITEISFIQLDGRVNATAYIRSLDTVNYFSLNMDFVTYTLHEVVNRTDFKPGSIAAIVAIPHIYSRDVKRAEDERRTADEVYGVTEYGSHLVEDYLSSGWHSALESIFYNGLKKETEWGELFEGQAESKFLHRLFIEINNPYELQIHDKAPFSRSYGIDYAHNYMIHAEKIDSEVTESILNEGETYTYAERARYCEKDEVKVDQLYTVIRKLNKDRNRRDCYVGISRHWDLIANEPPCLRGYQFVGNEMLSGIFFMRSNDVFGAMHANMFAFSTLTQYVAELTGFGKHVYYHFAVDAHIYSEFFDAVKEILEPETPSFKIE
jgi:thymidylate synthase